MVVAVSRRQTMVSYTIIIIIIINIIITIILRSGRRRLAAVVARRRPWTVGARGRLIIILQYL